MRASTSQAEAVIGVYDQKYRAYEYKPESRFRFAVRGELFDGKCPGCAMQPGHIRRMG
jgi:hypothetical protein